MLRASPRLLASSSAPPSLHSCCRRWLSLTSRTESKAAKRRKEQQRQVSPHLAFSKRPDKSSPAVKAMAHFDEHYNKVLGSRWPSARLALLSRPPKRCALINNFAGNTEETKERLKSLGCKSLKDEVEAEMNAIANRVQEEVRESPAPIVREAKRPQVRSLFSSRKVSEMAEEDESEDLEASSKSMSLDASVQDRIIKPEEKVLSGRNVSSAMHDFMPSTKLLGLEDAPPDEADFYGYRDGYEQVEGGGFQVRVVPAPPIRYPRELDAFFFPSCDLTRLPHPAATVLGTQDTYCLDLASILPVLALGLQPGDQVLDACSAPGGKSLAAAQTMLPASILCVDIKADRLTRVYQTMDAYLQGVGHMRERVTTFKRDALELPLEYPVAFNKVFCDVPCFTDRTMIFETEGSLFTKPRQRERIEMPQTQRDLLISAMKCCRPGGVIAYSTCTLSPMQNDNVVHMAIKHFWEETQSDFVVEDLSAAFQPFRSLMNLVGADAGMKYGQMVLPKITDNFGPSYVARIKRLS